MYFVSGSCTMVLPPSKRRKAPKIAWTRCPSFFPQSLRVQQVAPTSLCTGGKKDLLFYAARFSHFIDSLKRWRFDFSNAFTYALIKLSLRGLQFQTHYIFFLLLLFGKPVKPFKFLFKYKQQINCTECPT